jgi:tetratricopeptide (TPR) repeat protein
MQDKKNLLEVLLTDLKAVTSEQNWAKAEELISKCFDIYSHNAQPFWYANLNLIKRKLGKDSESKLACIDAIKYFPASPVGYICQAENALLKKDWALSEKLWNGLICRFPDSTHPSWRSNYCLSVFHTGSAGLSESANKIFDDFLLARNLNPDVYINSAINMSLAKQYNVANVLCGIAQEKFPQSAKVWRGSALVSNLRKLNLRSAFEWRVAASLSQGESRVLFHYEEIMSLIKAGKFDLVHKLIISLEESDPFHEKLFLAKVEIFLAQGNFEKALNILKSIPKNKIFQIIPFQKVTLICVGADLTAEEAKEYFFSENNADFMLQLENAYGQSSPSETRVFEILGNENQLWFKDIKRQLIELRARKQNFLKNRRCGSFTALAKYWLTFCNDDETDTLYRIAKKMFPESRVRLQLEKIIYRNKMPCDSMLKKYTEPWKRFLPLPDNSIAGQLNDIPFAKLHCIVVIKDESEMLPIFLSHYHNLGINSFVVINNGPSSEDVIDNSLLQAYKLHIINAPFSFAKNNHGMNWVNEFINAKKCEWLLFVDIDEFLVYPGYEHITLPQFIMDLENEGQSAVSAFMLDMYDEGFIKNSVPGSDISRHVYFYDEHFFVKDLHPPYRFITGGIRGSGKWSNILNKVPLIRISDGIRYIGNHAITHCNLGLNTAVLLHYKLFRDRSLFNLPEKEIIEHSRINDRSAGCIARHLEIYRRIDLKGIEDKSIKYRDSQQLISMGYLETSKNI